TAPSCISASSSHEGWLTAPIVAFNTNGWLKTLLQPMHGWVKWTAETGKGLFVRNDVLLALAWTSQFPRSQILFLRNEDYQAEPRHHLAAVHRFLGLREPTDEEWVRILGVERTNAQSSRYPRMLPETRALLMAFYQPFNQKLAALLGDDRWCLMAHNTPKPPTW
ncbi:sulfotransferase, partial [Haematococcus lacustris]